MGLVAGLDRQRDAEVRSGLPIVFFAGGLLGGGVARGLGSFDRRATAGGLLLGPVASKEATEQLKPGKDEATHSRLGEEERDASPQENSLQQLEPAGTVGVSCVPSFTCQLGSVWRKI